MLCSFEAGEEGVAEVEDLTAGGKDHAAAQPEKSLRPADADTCGRCYTRTKERVSMLGSM